MLWLGIVLLLLANIVIAFLILARGAGWPPFRETTSDSTTPDQKPDDKSGIDYDGQKDIILEDYSKKNGFIMIKVEEGKSREKIVELDNEANKYKIQGGFYWTIKSSKEDEEINELEEAVNFENEKLQELGLNFGFFFRFESNSFTINNATRINEYCGKIQNMPCGISIGTIQYEKYRNQDLENIKKYWIYQDISDSELKDDSKVQVWSLDLKETFNDASYTKIKRK